MYVHEQAASGGESHLASCAKIYNEIASTRPDVIHTLASPTWIFDKYKHSFPHFLYIPNSAKTSDSRLLEHESDTL